MRSTNMVGYSGTCFQFVVELWLAEQSSGRSGESKAAAATLELRRELLTNVCGPLRPAVHTTAMLIHRGTLFDSV